MEISMEISLQRSRKIAVQYVQAVNRRRAIALDESAAVVTIMQHRQCVDAATADLENDCLAKQLLPRAEEYVRLETERRLAIESSTLLGVLNSKLIVMNGGIAEVEIGSFNGTPIEYQFEDFCTAVGFLPRDQAEKVIEAVSELLRVLVDDLVGKKLPPPPEFTI